LKKYKVLLTELPMFLSPLRTFKTGTRKINLRTRESHSTTGLQRIRKSLRSSFFLLVLFKELKTMSTNSLRVSRNSTGSGRRRLTKSYLILTRKSLNLKILRKNSLSSLKVRMKLTSL